MERAIEMLNDLAMRLGNEGRWFDAASVRWAIGYVNWSMEGSGEAQVVQPEGKAPATPPKNKGGRPKKVPQPALVLTTGGGEPSTASKSADAAAPSANGEIPASMADLVTGP